MGNELKLLIENFQSISQGELVFHKGTTVIVGQSNSGKSATFRALKACLTNPAGSQRFIKKGTNKASVTLEYNGNQIVWNRTQKENSYTINNEEFIKTGRSNAFKLLEDTGFAVDSNENIMNIEEELQLPFPFGISKSDLFKLFENVFCVSDSAVVLKAAKEQEEKVKADIEILKSESNKNSMKLNELTDFRKSVDLSVLADMKNTLKLHGDRIDILREDLPAIKKTASLLTLGTLDDSISVINKVTPYQEALKVKKEAMMLKKLHMLSKKEVLDYNESSCIEAYQLLKTLRNVHSFTVPEVDIVNKLDDYKTLKLLKNVIPFEVEQKEFVNKLNKYQDLVDLRQHLENIKVEVKEKREQIKAESDKVEQITEQLKQFKVCPLCHQPLEH